RRSWPAGERRPDQCLVCAAGSSAGFYCGICPGGVRLSPTCRGDARRETAGGICANGPDRLVDDLPGNPAEQGTPARQMVGPVRDPWENLRTVHVGFDMCPAGGENQ